MKFAPATVLPVALVVLATVAMAALLAVTRPENDSSAAAAAEPTGIATVRTLTLTRTPAPARVPPTATSTRQPTLAPALVTPAGSAAGDPLAHLSGLRFVDTTVLENPGGAETFFPPGMPLEVLAGVARGQQPPRVSFFVVAPAPFPTMSGSAPFGADFTEDGGAGVVTGSALADGGTTNFRLEFSLSADRIDGTLTITDAAGATVLVLRWVG